MLQEIKENRKKTPYWRTLLVIYKGLEFCCLPLIIDY